MSVSHSSKGVKLVSCGYVQPSRATSHTWAGLLERRSWDEVEGHQEGAALHRGVSQDHIVDGVLIDPAVVVQLVLRDAVKGANCLPGHTRDAVHRPPHLDDAVFWLPDALDIDVQPLEEDPAVEAKRPEDELVVLDPLEGVPGVLEQDVVPVYAVCSTYTTRLAAVLLRGK
jgi:hypothetical protein